ncbi:carboxymuconolactone decarboxylase family protein [Rhodococcus pseudokoreensis]|uniref:Carboxymuconolactone decarboxylase family protein n=1 Tax=Rhodococcus pseudokoreensis TaxID=2811421 RepID=A0A974ZRZ6_9NOCA|nr:carboxymuconolactone decarboxylase family protein [Rhodococcus pseudokoreensis]QSE88210.1 carboxymuconolactone decarboxylase family protein [Rhodococcus pseudokoreensis]
MSTVSTRAAQRPSDGYLSRHLRTAALLERMDPAFARAAEELVGHPHRTGLLSNSVRALIVLAVESVIPQADEPRIAAAIDQALADGASEAEVLCTLEIACSIGLHTVSVGLPLLIEEMELAGRALPEQTMRQRQLQRALETTGPRPRPLNRIYGGILRMDPDYFAARVRFIDLPWEQEAVLDDGVKHLLSIAIDAVSPQHYVDGLRKHMREALQIGVSPEAILEVLELASVTGLRTLDVGLEVLAQRS